MKYSSKILAVLLALVLMLCLLPVTALATGNQTEQKDAAEEAGTLDDAAPAEAEAEETAGAEDTDAEEPDAEAAEEAEAEEAAEEEEELPPLPEAVYTEEGETFYAKTGDLVYNNAGTVYNNAGTVYNNGGTVYNNGGVVYNNAGTVYSNGGIVYNNGGKVYNNGGVVYTFGGDVEECLIAGYYRVTLAGDYSAFAEIQGLEPEPGAEDSLLIAQDATVTITPKEGFTLLDVEAEGVEITKNEDGSCSLSQPEASLELALRFQANAPVFSLAEGTYAEGQSVELSAAEGAEIYYTTDGELPGEENSTLYEGPIALTEGMTITAVAVAEGAEMSPAAAASYAVVTVEAPVFEAVEEGYNAPAAQGIAITNSGTVTAHVESVELTGEGAASFSLNRTGSGRIGGGTTDDDTWTLRPVSRLEAGSYSAVVVLTFDSGSTAEVEVSFEVKAAEEEAEETEAAEEEAEEAEAEKAAEEKA